MYSEWAGDYSVIIQAEEVLCGEKLFLSRILWLITHNRDKKRFQKETTCQEHVEYMYKHNWQKLQNTCTTIYSVQYEL